MKLALAVVVFIGLKVYELIIRPLWFVVKTIFYVLPKKIWQDLYHVFLWLAAVGTILLAVVYWVLASMAITYLIMHGTLVGWWKFIRGGGALTPGIFVMVILLFLPMHLGIIFLVKHRRRAYGFFADNWAKAKRIAGI